MNKYLYTFKLSFLRTFRNKKTLVGLSIFLITCLLIFSHLWEILQTKLGSLNLTKEELLWYIAINQTMLVSLPDPQDEIRDDLRNGKLACLLLRPISYLKTKFFESLGQLTPNLLILGTVSFTFTYSLALSSPFSFLDFILIFFLSILSGTIAIQILLLIGILAFWFHEINPFYWLFEKLLFIFGGLMIPLSAYPPWMGKIAKFTPFPLILSLKSELSFGISKDLIFSFLVQFMLWSLGLLILTTIVYRRGEKILNIEGG
jgi:ABC-2 type transport system permease protein